MMIFKIQVCVKVRTVVCVSERWLVIDMLIEDTFDFLKREQTRPLDDYNHLTSYH